MPRHRTGTQPTDFSNFDLPRPILPLSPADRQWVKAALDTAGARPFARVVP
ncbi:hypothetical protein [Rhizobium giardinii]|jgi:hypothetical protein|uniref:hypothetical protein n=1 Tax=Rhizobium giardinii TaxID=56731 RepID=UPI0013AFC2CF